MIHISNMSGKLKGLRAINSNTLTNTFCQKMQKTNSICKVCYSQRMLTTFRKSAVPPFQRNSEFLAHKVLHSDALPYVNDAIFRFNGHGEVVNANHFKNLANIARRNPQTTFGWWTKRKDLVLKFKHLIPKNVILIYSSNKVNELVPVVPAGFHKVFSVYTEDFAKNVKLKINCHKDCMDCKLCYTKNKVGVINEIAKAPTAASQQKLEEVSA